MQPMAGCGCWCSDVVFRVAVAAVLSIFVCIFRVWFVYVFRVSVLLVAAVWATFHFGTILHTIDVPNTRNSLVNVQPHQQQQLRVCR